MKLKQIENLNIDDRNWSFIESGVSYLLSSAGRRNEEQKSYVLKSTEGLKNERYEIFGGGNLHKDNEAKIHFILNKIGTNELYIISADDLNNEMLEKY